VFATVTSLKATSAEWIKFSSHLEVLGDETRGFNSQGRPQQSDSSATLGSIEQDVSQSSTTCWKGLNHFNDV
jgi:hypothetical protein